MHKDIGHSSAYFSIPENIDEFLKDYQRVQPLDPDASYPPYKDDEGYLWKPCLHLFRREDEKLSDERTFRAAEKKPYVGYEIELTEEQQKALEPFCCCPIHRVEDKQTNVCSCCVGCLHTDSPQQSNVVAAIKLMKQGLERTV